MGGSAIYWSESHEELKRLVELLKAPVYLNAMGRGSISQEHPLFFNRSRRSALAKARRDRRDRHADGLPAGVRQAVQRRGDDHPGRQRPDGARPQPRRPDPGRVRHEGVPAGADRRAGRRQVRPRRRGSPQLRTEEDKTRGQMEEWMASDRNPIHPLRLCAEIANFVDENTVVVGDGGDIVSHASKILPVNLPGQWYDPGPFGTLGVGTGFCMAINSVYPNKRIIMVNGDGAFGLNGFDFDTFVRFNIPVVSDRRQRPPVGPDRRRPEGDVRQRARGGQRARRQLPLRQDRRGHGRPRRVRDGAGPDPPGHPARASTAGSRPA